MKQFLSSWKCDVAKDTICYWDIKSFGTGIEGYFKYVTNGKIVTEGKELWGYLRNLNKNKHHLINNFLYLQHAELP
jgi:serine kinase of HPr protein (carbohydrate metabolism regulator)